MNRVARTGKTDMLLINVPPETKSILAAQTYLKHLFQTLHKHIPNRI